MQIFDIYLTLPVLWLWMWIHQLSNRQCRLKVGQGRHGGTSSLGSGKLRNRLKRSMNKSQKNIGNDDGGGIGIL